MAEVRLGDIVDDHCSRCHMIMDHSVVAMVGDEVKRVRCRTCNHEHDYRHGAAPHKKTKVKLSPYEEVLASITAGRPGAPPSEPPRSGKPSRPSTRSRSRSSTARPRSLHTR